MADVTEADREQAREINRGAGMPAWERGEPANLEDRIAHALADRGAAARVAMGNEAAKFVMRSWGSRGNLPLAVLAESIQRRASEPEPTPSEGKEAERGDGE